MTVAKLIPEIEKKVNRPFSEKLSETSGIIQKRLVSTDMKIALAWSGGKDSTLVLYFVRMVYPDIPVVFNNTGVEFPETVKFVHQLADEWKLNLIETKPIKSFWKCVSEYGFSLGKQASNKENGHKKNNSCCYFCKEKPAQAEYQKLEIRGIFTGITAVESRNRMFNARKGTCYQTVHEKIWKVHPILWWTEDEVREYIRQENIPLNPVYTRGAERCGCMPCTAYKTWESELSKLNPNMYSIIKLRKDKQYTMLEVFK